MRDRRRTHTLVEKLGLLHELTLFADLPPADLEAIGAATLMWHCSGGQQILTPDDPPERLHILKQGRARLYRTNAAGRQLTIDIYGPGTIFGDMRLLGQRRVPDVYAEAIEDGVVCTMTAAELGGLIARYPVIGLNVIRHLSARLDATERELEAMAYDRVDQRLARRLLDIGERFGSPIEGGTLLGPRFSQQELADLVGTTRETLAHTLSSFRRDGLIDTTDHRLLIRDAERLARVADGNSAG
jgi:CRP-like cAMP-binding protein